MTWSEYFSQYSEKYVLEVKDIQFVFIERYEGRLRDEHIKEIQEAIQAGLEVPDYNLREYRFRPQLFKLVRAYCRCQKINLDA